MRSTGMRPLRIASVILLGGEVESGGSYVASMFTSSCLVLSSFLQQFHR
jgi:hypothetical protein